MKRPIGKTGLSTCVAMLLASCQSGPGVQRVLGNLSPGLSEDERDAITRADRTCDHASTVAISDPTSPCYVHRP